MPRSSIGTDNWQRGIGHVASVPMRTGVLASKLAFFACCITTWAVGVALAPPFARANDWKIQPSAIAYESFTSNAGLEPSGKEKSDFFTTISPTIDIEREGPRFILDLNYNLNAVIYANEHSLDEINHDLRLDSKAVVVPELLFLDADAAIAQEPKESERPSSGSRLTASTNESTVYTYRISPSLRNHFGNFANSELRYTFGQVFGSGLADATIQRVDSSLTSGSQFPRLSWALNENAAFSSGSRDVSDIFAAASGEYHVNRKIDLIGSAGYERISDETLDDEPDGPVASAGVRLTPGPRTSLEVLYNHRFDSNFATGNLQYDIDTQSSVRASYRERVETSQLVFIDNLDFLERDETGAFVDSRTERLFHLDESTFGLEDNAFRLRTASVSLHLVRGRNTWDALAYWEQRTTDAIDERDTAFGGGFTWTHQLSDVASFNIAARYRHENSDNPSESNRVDLAGAGVALVNSLDDTLDAVLAVNYTRQIADNPDDEFDETVVSVGLIKHF